MPSVKERAPAVGISRREPVSTREEGALPARAEKYLGVDRAPTSTPSEARLALLEVLRTILWHGESLVLQYCNNTSPHFKAQVVQVHAKRLQKSATQH